MMHKMKEEYLEQDAPDHGDMSVFELTMKGPLLGDSCRFTIGRVCDLSDNFWIFCLLRKSNIMRSHDG